MIIAPHVMVSTAIATKFKKTWLIFLLSFLSHFILDAIPHWGYGRPYNAFNIILLIIDITIAIVFVSVLTRPFDGRTKRIIFLAAIIAISPDLIQTLAYTLFIQAPSWFYYIHSVIQTELPFIWGIISQIIVFIICYISIRRSAAKLPARPVIPMSNTKEAVGQPIREGEIINP